MCDDAGGNSIHLDSGTFEDHATATSVVLCEQAGGKSILHSGTFEALATSALVCEDAGGYSILHSGTTEDHALATSACVYEDAGGNSILHSGFVEALAMSAFVCEDACGNSILRFSIAEDHALATSVLVGDVASGSSTLHSGTIEDHALATRQVLFVKMLVETLFFILVMVRILLWSRQFLRVKMLVETLLFTQLLASQRFNLSNGICLMLLLLPWKLAWCLTMPISQWPPETVPCSSSSTESLTRRCLIRAVLNMMTCAAAGQAATAAAKMNLNPVILILASQLSLVNLAAATSAAEATVATVVTIRPILMWSIP